MELQPWEGQMTQGSAMFPRLRAKMMNDAKAQGAVILHKGLLHKGSLPSEKTLLPATDSSRGQGLQMTHSKCISPKKRLQD